MRAIGVVLPRASNTPVRIPQSQQQRSVVDTWQARWGEHDRAPSPAAAPTPTPRIVWSAISELPQSEAVLLQLRFSAKRVRSYAEIASHLGASVQRVRQIEWRALSRLRAISLAANGAGDEWDAV
jgi:RNA polymerase sigma factor (sigma-70 family)